MGRRGTRTLALRAARSGVAGVSQLRGPRQPWVTKVTEASVSCETAVTTHTWPSALGKKLVLVHVDRWGPVSTGSACWQMAGLLRFLLQGGVAEDGYRSPYLSAYNHRTIEQPGLEGSWKIIGPSFVGESLGQVVLTTQFSGISNLGEGAFKSITQILVKMDSMEPRGGLGETPLLTGCHPESKTLITTPGVQPVGQFSPHLANHLTSLCLAS